MSRYFIAKMVFRCQYNPSILIDSGSMAGLSPWKETQTGVNSKFAILSAALAVHRMND
jgi:hypothetical protein